MSAPSAVVAEIPVAPPLGPLYATVAGDRLLRLTFDRRPDGPGDLQRGPGCDLGIIASLSDGVARWLATGDAGFAVPLDLASVGAFRAGVYEALCRVGPGQVVTYGELARRSGHPGAARAVGRAMATNPWPLVVPCHRVVPAAGGIGNYAGGAGRKRWMLEVEATQADRWSPQLGDRLGQAGP